MLFRIDRKREYIPLDPQPDEKSVLTIVRYYTSLVASKEYRRRISWLLMNNEISDRAVFEYFGQHVVGVPHGNTKDVDSKCPFERTPASTMDQIGSMVKSARPQDVYNKLIVDNDVSTAPRDSRVVRNKKTYDRRATNASQGRSLCRNIGDEFQIVFDLIKTDRFIRRICAQKDCLPSIILYTDRQIADIKSMCFDASGSVVGFDKTFNLGAVYVTVSVYKNIALHRKRSGESPIFIGPIFIHGKSDIETYADFFGHFSIKLLGCDFQALTLGSDDELAMRKCIMHFFPRAKYIVCSRHLHENVGRKLDEMIGKSSDIRRRLMDALFGSNNGLVNIDNVISFDEAVGTLQQPSGLLSKGPVAFQQYFNRRLLPLLRNNCASGRSKWTNNNCESINHVLKQAVQWRPNQLPDLIDKIRMLVDGQFADADRALCGRGDFVLRPAWAKHQLTVDAWTSMTANQRMKAIDACFRMQGVATSTSTDGSVTVPTTPGGGRKLNQIKRSRPNRTTTTATSKKAKLDMA